MTKKDEKKHENERKSSWFIKELRREINMIKGWFKKESETESPSISRSSRTLSKKITKSDEYKKEPKPKKYSASNALHKKEKPKMPVVYRIFIGVILLFLFSTVAGTALLFNSIKYDAPDEPKDAADIQEYEESELIKDVDAYVEYEEIEAEDFVEVVTDTSILEADNLHYILLIGLDARSPDNWSNASTDVMKVVVLDEDRKTIKLISLMRDILVPIEGHIEADGSQKYGKLNSVYFFNGPDELCNSVEKHFGIPVDEYIIINWVGTTKIIDILGGVEVNIKYSEITEVNKKIRNNNKARNIEYASELYKDGKQILNGNQALAYMRVRYVGNGDYERVERQVVVLESLFSSLKSASLNEILSLAASLQDVVNTNIKSAKMLDYATMGYSMLDADVSSITIPYGPDGKTHFAGRYNGKYVLNVDFEANLGVIQDFLFGEE